MPPLNHPSSEPCTSFGAAIARRLREGLGLTPHHVAHSLRSSFGVPYASPELVAAWESGDRLPTEAEVAALAGVLWCAPADLTGRRNVLRELRLARGLAPEEIARSVGMYFLSYVRMEDAGVWDGNRRQSAALARLLDLTLPELIALTGREGELDALLRDAVGTRWQPFVQPIADIVPLDRRLLSTALQELHQDFREQAPADRGRGPGGPAGEAVTQFLDRIVDRFWSTVEVHAA
ncbi:MULTISPECIES: XRE family transcriptional regulator [unclassified Streptomyces]|uniref:XRE family transcriptional regulator n=1 Tax=unclassified Streptomyces TaxID=2593676 RepID=UPI0037FB758D